MIFSSYAFVLGFLPLSLVGFYSILKWRGGAAAVWFMIVASLVFYGSWNPWHLPIFLVSLGGNYVFVRLLVHSPSGRTLALAICLNLAGLIWLKYRNFLLGGLGAQDLASLLPPLGISFFTFQQISLLIDVRLGKVKPRSFSDYAAFIAFFPHLPAGPIVYYREMEERLTKLHTESTIAWPMVAGGVVVFAMGLFKKVMLGDPIGREATLVFHNVQHLTTLEAWYGALAFTLQLYFDFSGYADMAVGLGMLFGIQLPVNFRNPYRACSITDFWKRWHLTMTRFFIANVYTPVTLHLARTSVARRFPAAIDFAVVTAFPIILTFLMSGLWHGAGWTFIMLGLIHGVALATHAGWRRAKMPRLPSVLGWTMTMLVLIVSLVFFRSGKWDDAIHFLQVMFDPVHHLVLPHWMASIAAHLSLPSARIDIFQTGTVSLLLPFWVAGLFAAAILMPEMSATWEKTKLGWRTALLTGCAIVISLAGMATPVPFIYFQF